MLVSHFLVENFLRRNFNNSHTLAQFVFEDFPLLDRFLSLHSNYKDKLIEEMTVVEIEQFVVSLQLFLCSTLYPHKIELHIFGAMAALLFDKQKEAKGFK